MIEDLTIAALVWYYFNIICIAGIIFFLLAIMYKRAGRIIINTSESPYRQDNTMMQWTFRMAMFAIIFFGLREWGSAMIEFSQASYEYLGGYFG